MHRAAGSRQLAKRVPVGQPRSAVGPREQHGIGVEVAGEETEQSQAARVRPLEIVEHHQQGREPGLAAKMVRDCGEKRKLPRIARSDPDVALKIGQHVRVVRVEGAEYSLPGPQDRCALTFPAGSPGRPASELARVVGTVIEQRGLPDPGLTRDQHQPTTALKRPP